MVVQHNLRAVNSNRMLGLTTASQSKSTEKLSSGYKINRAADDAAGLSISEKMRKQIRGLTQASANAQDGISAVQTAEGALGEVQDMLQRMNELAVKAANGTNSENDREYIQNEIYQLSTEIDRVAETTKFNETYLLKGDKNVTSYKFAYAATAADDTTTVDDETGDADSSAGVTAAALKAGGILPTANAKYTYNATASQWQDEDGNDKTAEVDAAFTLTGTPAEGDEITFTKGSNTSASVTAGDSNSGVTTVTMKTSGTLPTANAKYTYNATVSQWQDEDGNDKTAEVDAAFTLTDAPAEGDTITFTPATSTADNVAVTTPASSESTETSESTEDSEAAAGPFYDKDGNKIPANALVNYLETTDGTSITLKDGKTLYDENGSAVTFNAENFTASALPAGALTLTLHVGADATANNQISLNIDAMSAEVLGVNNLKVDGSDDTSARNAIDTIKEAIQKVSTQRSSLGAIQNRLEHTINNLDNVVENTTSAEAQIRDTDMASEMVKYSNNNILAQAGQAMLAQANQSNQGVLSLLG